MSTAAGPAPPGTPPLRLSVVVPAHRCAGTLRQAIAALRASDLPAAEWELVVVDDASGDETADVAAALADHVVRLEGAPRGPAFARNRGAEVARGELVAFVDADVCVHPDALRRMVALCAAAPDVGAVFGAYDTAPPAPGLVSRYRNLVHHYEHVRGAGDAETFWAGCGAVRRELLQRSGGFDERRYPRPQIEDIELGYRLRALGQRILLAPEIRCTHLKRWTLRGMIVTDVRDRGVPWMELLLAGGGAGRSTLNVRGSEKLYTVLVGAAGVAAAAAAVTGEARWLLPAAAATGAVVVGNAPLLLWLARRRGAAFALASIPLRLLYYVLNAVSAAWGGVRYLRRAGGAVGRGAPLPLAPRIRPPPPAR